MAVGRDFTDVPPNKGVYRGAGQRVDPGARRDPRSWTRLPSLSWQEQLPPLDVPLTAIETGRTPDTSSDEQAQQQ